MTSSSRDTQKKPKHMFRRHLRLRALLVIKWQHVCYSLLSVTPFMKHVQFHEIITHQMFSRNRGSNYIFVGKKVIFGKCIFIYVLWNVKFMWVFTSGNVEKSATSNGRHTIFFHLNFTLLQPDKVHAMSDMYLCMFLGNSMPPLLFKKNTVQFRRYKTFEYR